MASTGSAVGPEDVQDGDRKDVEPMAARVPLPDGLDVADPDQALRQFVGQSARDERAVARRYRAAMATKSADEAGIFVIDGTTFPRQNTHSVGVRRQCRGAPGKAANCRGAVGVHRKYAFGNLPAAARLIRAVRLRRSRWPVGQGYQQAKEELGRDHFEGRLWRGFYHHACLVMLAYGFLALERPRARRGRARPGKKGGRRGPVIALPAIRRALVRLLAPIGRHDCAYCRPWLAHGKLKLTESP